ncbi:uncharacterized protein LOC124438358 isoform X11 [Xenia sp. Carnegie-2017]|uniref:uncharacterized protein LOC124438358 isoform X11 n=1 Tax=Xenia sp. Carnegie-2017 TaxID=2897299 RepID=UPI001F03C0DF|nr:uncharacterized protein LOC124438358 isoform X11 [Xenia sp. Carnegie-2017]
MLNAEYDPGMFSGSLRLVHCVNRKIALLTKEHLIYMKNNFMEKFEEKYMLEMERRAREVTVKGWSESQGKLLKGLDEKLEEIRVMRLMVHRLYKRQALLKQETAIPSLIEGKEEKWSELQGKSIEMPDEELDKMVHRLYKRQALLKQETAIPSLIEGKEEKWSELQGKSIEMPDEELDKMVHRLCKRQALLKREGKEEKWSELQWKSIERLDEELDEMVHRLCKRQALLKREGKEEKWSELQGKSIEMLDEELDEMVHRLYKRQALLKQETAIPSLIEGKEEKWSELQGKSIEMLDEELDEIVHRFCERQALLKREITEEGWLELQGKSIEVLEKELDEMVHRLYKRQALLEQETAIPSLIEGKEEKWSELQGKSIEMPDEELDKMVHRLCKRQALLKREGKEEKWSELQGKSIEMLDEELDEIVHRLCERQALLKREITKEGWLELQGKSIEVLEKELDEIDFRLYKSQALLNQETAIPSIEEASGKGWKVERTKPWGEQQTDVRQELRMERRKDVRQELTEEERQDVRQELQEEKREDLRHEVREEEQEDVRKQETMSPHHLTTSSENLFLDETSSDESSYDDNCDDDSFSEENSCGETSNDESSNGGCSRDDTLLNVHNLNLDDDRLFEKTFLDNKFSIRDDVRKKLRSLPWMRGEYGTASANEKIPYFHLYVSVDYEKGSFDDDFLKNQINKKFGPDASKYFEFRPKPPTTPEFQLLSKVVISVRRKNKGISKGRLTMFCCHNGKHYALACCHVCYNGDGDDQLYKMLREEEKNPKQFKSHLEENQYFVIENEETELGHFSKYSLKNDVDIMSIEVNPNVSLNFRKKGIETPSWKYVWKVLKERVHATPPRVVNVKKYERKGREGQICDIDYSYFDPKEDIDVANAVLVKSKKNFLKNGESGVLVYFHVEGRRRIPFGYGVGRYIHKNLDKNYKYFICFKLDRALTDLFGEENCESCGCFDQCANPMDSSGEIASSNADTSSIASMNLEPCNDLTGELTVVNNSYQEHANVVLTDQSSNECNLETTFSELPDHIRRKLEERLKDGNELLENDWRSLYKALNLPKDQENIIAEKYHDNPTRYVINTWLEKDGQHASLKALLLALKECGHECLLHEIEKDLRVQLSDQSKQGAMNGIYDRSEKKMSA